MSQLSEKDCFSKYFFIYKDMLGQWNECRNPAFIAEHTCCRALKKSEIVNIAKHINNLNNKKGK